MSATIEVAIWLALKARIESRPDPLSAIDVAWPAEAYTPKYSGSQILPFIRVGRVSADPVRRQIAPGKPHERTGILVITLVYPLGQDISVYDQLAAQIAEHFADGTQMVSNGVCVSVTSYPSVMDGFEDNGYWQTPVRIPWRCFA